MSAPYPSGYGNPAEHPPAGAHRDRVREAPAITTVFGGKHAANRQQKQRDETPVPGAGSLALLAQAVLLTVVAVAVEFNAITSPTARDAFWFPLAAVLVALLSGFSGVRLRFGASVDLLVGGVRS